MGKKSSAVHLTSNISSAANPKASLATKTPSNSSILKSSFAPSRFQLALFASVIQGLDSQHVRIHTTSGRLQSDYALGSRASINCLEWGFYGQRRHDSLNSEANRKRKRSDQANGIKQDRASRDLILALGTSDSEIQLLAPSEAKVIGVLKDGHSNGVKDFKFAPDGAGDYGWSIGGDSRAVKWSLKKSKVLQSIIIPNGPARVICPLASSTLCASHLVQKLDAEMNLDSTTYTASTTPVHTMIAKPFTGDDPFEFLTASEFNSVVNVFREGGSTMVGALRSENEVIKADLWSRISDHSRQEDRNHQSGHTLPPQQALLTINKDGVLELFPSPFDFETASSKQALGSREAKKTRSRKSIAQLQIVRPGKIFVPMPVIDASFQDNDIVLAWAEGGANVSFHHVPWRNDETEQLLISGLNKIEKAKDASGLHIAKTNGTKAMVKTQVDDSRAVIANGAGSDEGPLEEGQTVMIEISSGEEESEVEEDEEPLPEVRSTMSEDGKGGAKTVGEEDVVMEDAEQDDKATIEAAGDAREVNSDPDEDDQAPTFGDLLRAKAPPVVDVPSMLTESSVQNLVPAGAAASQATPQGLSLGTVLTQALRTNDISLLETCFYTRDLSNVRATIERLESSFAAILLQRLAERLHSRPGRAGSLMVWIQWTLVAHGGYLASQPEILKRLRSLHTVVRERASSLPTLLSLKGKLDMLEAQMNLRSSMLQRGRKMTEDEDEDEDEDGEAMIYVEGQEEDFSKVEADDEGESDDDDDEDEDEDQGVEEQELMGGSSRKKSGLTSSRSEHRNGKRSTSTGKAVNGISPPALGGSSDESSDASDDDNDGGGGNESENVSSEPEDEAVEEALFDIEASSSGSSRSAESSDEEEEDSDDEDIANDGSEVEHESSDSEFSIDGNQDEALEPGSTPPAQQPPSKRPRQMKNGR